jgi:DNA-binding GntR family transcriptional regulator
MIRGVEAIDYDGEVPVWRQVYNLLLARIDRGDIPAGRPIPSKATLSQELGVAGNTVEKAVRLLKDEGVVRGVPGRGVYVVRREQR